MQWFPRANLFLVLILAQLLSQWSFAEDNLAYTCEEYNISTCNPHTSPLLLPSTVCEVEKKAFECDAHFAKYPDQRSKERRCDPANLCKTTASRLLDIAGGCLVGAFGDWLEEAWQNGQKRAEFQAACDRNPACRRELVTDIGYLNALSDEQLSQISTHDLQQRIAAFTESQTRVAGVLAAQTRKPPRPDHDEGLRQRQEIRISVLYEVILKSIQKNADEYRKFQCYNDAGKAGMICSTAAFIGTSSTIAFKGVSAARALRAEAALKSAASQAARAAGAVEPAPLVKNYKTVAMKDSYKGEHKGRNDWRKWHVKYLTEDERALKRLTVKDGRFYDAGGNPVTTGDRGWIFVMDERGNIYSSGDYEFGKFHHSSFLAGQPVSSAGELVIENGVLKSLNNRSGHYHPSPELSDQLLLELRSKGLGLEDVHFDYYH